MSSVLNAGSATYISKQRDVTYDLTTQAGLSDFWSFVLYVFPVTINPGMASCDWGALDKLVVKLPNGGTVRITGIGQIWLHGKVLDKVPYTWNSCSLCIIDVENGIILTLRLYYEGSSDIRLRYGLHTPNAF